MHGVASLGTPIVRFHSHQGSCKHLSASGCLCCGTSHLLPAAGPSQPGSSNKLSSPGSQANKNRKEAHTHQKQMVLLRPASSKLEFGPLGFLELISWSRGQTVLTIGTACPAGLFVPSLFIGACLGRGPEKVEDWSNIGTVSMTVIDRHQPLCR